MTLIISVGLSSLRFQYFRRSIQRIFGTGSALRSLSSNIPPPCGADSRECEGRQAFLLYPSHPICAELFLFIGRRRGRMQNPSFDPGPTGGSRSNTTDGEGDERRSREAGDQSRCQVCSQCGSTPFLAVHLSTLPHRRQMAGADTI